ncbi:MAG TPA: DUF6596 domain-containing protein [Terriglobales bacterium]|nr:DUF6596 domain-containing protein [Terriglobales bacterium]
MRFPTVGIATHSILIRRRHVALMCLNKAQLPPRVDDSGKLNSLFEQDRLLWDQGLIGEGLQLLELSAEGSELTEYHVEAGIAAVHATAQTMQATDWDEIVSLYDKAITTLQPSADAKAEAKKAKKQASQDLSESES